MVLLFIGVTVYIATLKGDFKVKQTAIIHSPRGVVFDYVNDYKNWETFGSWMTKEHGITFVYPAKTMGAGAQFNWDNGSDNGSLKTYFVKENNSIQQKGYFNGTTAEMHWKLNDTVGGTKITVEARGKMDLLTKISTFFSGGFGSVANDALEKSLRNLDKTLAYEMKTYNIKVNGIVQRNSGFCLKQTVTCRIKSLPRNIKIMMPKMLHFFKKNNLSMSGKPFILYERYDRANDIVTFSVCAPTAEQIFITSGSEITSGEIVPFTCLKTTLTGDYSHLKEAWTKAENYIRDNGYTPNFAGKYAEVYIKTIDDVKQPSKWITEIHIPVFPKAAPAQSSASISTTAVPVTPTSSTEPTMTP